MQTAAQAEPNAQTIDVESRESGERISPWAAQCLHEWFEASVDAGPGRAALICGSLTLSYAELDSRANQLAHYLRAKGARQGSLVGIWFERSELPIVALLACMKAGAAYVPIDPVYPDDRVRHILTESQPALVLTERSLAPRWQSLALPLATVVVDEEQGEIGRAPSHRLSRGDSGVSPSHLCYVIYTSGSTGRPKGVMTEHRSVVAFCRAFNEICRTTAADRIFQGFSLGFDGSVEEMWMAFTNGATLVVGSREDPRLGNELAQWLAERGVTYLSTVPTLLSTMTESIPTLTQLVVSGEVCPPDLVAKWSRPSLRLLNVYGPTEATVNTTAAECRPGRPVTIGKPLAGYELLVLDPEMRPVPKGQKGELYIGGEGVARGYLRQAELTAERFVDGLHRVTRREPWAPAAHLGARATARLYRTGDIVRLNEEGNFEFFGRIDSQVKIRGYRVELSEIESVLLELENVRSAVVRLVERSGLQELAAFVVPNDPSAALDRSSIRRRLEARLPRYMVPGYLDVIGELPMLSSGKVDRARLPVPRDPLAEIRGHLIEPRTHLERELSAVWQGTLGLGRISIDDDFFADLGGHSLRAAQAVTQLRSRLGRDVALRDIYRFPTVRSLAEHLESSVDPSLPRGVTGAEVRASSRSVFASVPRVTRAATVLLQATTLYLYYGLITAPIWAFLLFGEAKRPAHLVLIEEFVVALLAIVVGWPLLLAFSIAAKWLIIGRYRPGRYPVWGLYYFRWWLVTRIQRLSGCGGLAGTPVMRLYARLMGARIGERCILDSAHFYSWDLLTIGEGSTVGADCQLSGYRVEDGMLIVDSIEVGKRCFIGIHSALGLGAKMGDDCRLDDQSLLPDGAEMGPGESRRGSPAQPAPVAVPSASSMGRRQHPVLFGVLHFVLLFVLGALFVAFGLPVAAIFVLGSTQGGAFGPFAAHLLGVPAAVLSYGLGIAAVKWLVLGRARPGVYPIESGTYLRTWFVDQLLRVARILLLPLYTTIYFPWWLRLLGAKVGSRAELSTVWYFSPDLLDIGPESFLADGSIIGGKRIFADRFEIARNRIGARTFVGNGAILPVGTDLGDKCLLGVLSAPPVFEGAVVPDRTEWLGSPAFALPNRHKTGGFDETVTYRPTARLYIERALIDALRILVPGYLWLAAMRGATLMLAQSDARWGMPVTIALSPFMGGGVMLASALAVAAIKWLVMGRFGPVIRPLWSPYVWLNEMVNGIYESVMAPILTPLLGTPFAAPVLRLMGCKIGRRTFIETTLFSEFDLVTVGDYAALNYGAVIQTHLFEDRIMKSSVLKIRDDCSVGNMAVVLYETELLDRSAIGPMSLLMKGETVPEGGRWHGIPTVPIRPV